MSRDLSLYLTDIVHSIDKIQKYTGGMNYDDKSLSLGLPHLDEQKAIADYIETETARIDAKIAKTKRIIELQKEYRTALISEAVTGKIKVPQCP